MTTWPSPSLPKVVKTCNPLPAIETGQKRIDHCVRQMSNSNWCDDGWLHIQTIRCKMQSYYCHNRCLLSWMWSLCSCYALAMMCCLNLSDTWTHVSYAVCSDVSWSCLHMALCALLIHLFSCCCSSCNDTYSKQAHIYLLLIWSCY